MSEIDDILSGIDHGMEGNVIEHSEDVKRQLEESAWAEIYERYEMGEYSSLEEATERFLAWRNAWCSVGRSATKNAVDK